MRCYAPTTAAARALTVASLLSSVLAAILIAEFFLLPSLNGLPRDVILMGFAATPHTLVDDTPINSMGFTGDVIGLTQDPGTIRILTLGGSAMFNRRMTERLKQRLARASTQRIELLGAALRTHTTWSSVLKYKLLRKYRFDVVIIYHGINDLWANHIRIRDFQRDYSHLGAYYKRSALLDNCLICRSIYNTWLYSKPNAHMGDNLSGFASENIFRGNMLTLINDIRSDGATPILMTFAWNIPAGYTREAFQSHAVGYNNPNNYDSWPVEIWGSPDYVREGLRRHNGILYELAKSHDVLLIDQERLMGKDLKWFGDMCHFSEEGTERFIEHIVDFFVDHQHRTSGFPSQAPGQPSVAPAWGHSGVFPTGMIPTNARSNWHRHP